VAEAARQANSSASFGIFMNFRSIAQLSDQLLHWAHQLPPDIEVVAGVPRSGLLAANILSLYLNVPLTDLDGLISGRCFESGSRRRRRSENGNGRDIDFLHSPRKVLVVDDSMLNGRAMLEARARIDAAQLPHTVLYSAVYVTPERRNEVDYYCEVVNGPRVFEWNVFHGEILWKFFVSLDGVLCTAPAADPADPERYTAALREVRPLIVPSREIGWVVAERPENSRGATEAWLQENGYQYRQLLMVGAPDTLSGRQTGLVAGFKAELYRNSDATLFIERSFWESVAIARLSGRHVLCADAMQLVHPGTVPLARADLPMELHPTVPPTMRQRVTRFTKGVARQFLPQNAQQAVRRLREPGS
jgi:uncharacterized HAD superfamily protein/hypoxanthine phosphoribosyltransferase